MPEYNRITFYIEYYVDNSAVRVRRRTITHCIVDFSCSICEGRQREERSTRRKVHLMRRKSEVRLTMALLRLGGGSVSD